MLPSADADLPTLSLLAVTPFEHPDVSLAAAVARAGAIGVLDLGRAPAEGRRALRRLLATAHPSQLGVRIPEGSAWQPMDVPADLALILTGSPDGVAAFARQGHRVLCQVVSLVEAHAALDAGATGLVAKGEECGGRVGATGTFVLLQSLLSDARIVADHVPVWAQGGLGAETAAAALAGGAVGVVLDVQLALMDAATTTEALRAVLVGLDGSETAVTAGTRLLSRPGCLAPADTADANDVRTQLGAADPARELIALGQDAVLAHVFATRYRTVDGAVRGLLTAMAGHAALAAAQAALRPGGPLSDALGTRVPIAQGPMTRVSDRPEFAEAVADAGALSFLALALLEAEQARPILQETARRLAGRAWGVGVLGFVPAELREAQLAVVREARPTAVLIAGGRPSQARALESDGIATFLHVPSPGLLDLFLKDGARRFVLEGRECGGHVGPRTSFVLWQSQIERLLAFASGRAEGLAGVDVLFAGGIHDARSAAMVAVAAAPIVALGARIGVLMGTAYLFTREAVTTGAILPGFQQVALACENTALLETGPGHETRCATTGFVRTFEAERERLVNDGLEPRERWATLEQLNLGRLRLASKGLVREADGLTAVDAATQRREGMYMIGDVATLRREVTTLAALHDEVTRGAVAWLAARPPATPQAEAEARPLDVAIVGMAGLFPGAPDLATFWSNVVDGKNSIREIPPERWSVAQYFDASSQNGEKTPSKWGGFLDAIAFDPLSYGIPPKSLAAIEPIQLLSLEVARRALADAGLLDRSFDRERTSVIVGAEAGTELAGGYGFRAFWPQLLGALPPELDAILPKLTEDSFPGVLANVIAGRIANRLDLGGVNYTVDAACASSLAAIDLGCKELVSGSSNVVLCGGADTHNSVNDYLLFSSVHALSPTGQCRTFSADADGIVLGEAVVFVVLKRLDDARRDGDRIYAVIEGVAGSSDGKSLGLTAPRREGQIRAVDRVYGRSGVTPSSVGLVEAHGTGTVVGDRTELQTLTEVFARNGGSPRGSVALGSVKSQIGHTKCAAGLTGLIKAALALHHRALPPTLHVVAPNPGYDPKTSPFALSAESRPWVSPGSTSPRRAAVSAFGFGGTNFHSVLREDAHATTGAARWPSELFLFRGASPERAQETIDRVLAIADPALALVDLASAVAATHTDAPVQAAVVADTVAELRSRLTALRARWADGPGAFVADVHDSTPPRLAFLFPGQGSQRVGMLRELFVAFPRLIHHLGHAPDVAACLYPPMAFGSEQKDAQRAALTDTRIAQPALGLVELALVELLGELGVTPDLVAGHSYGELVALAAAGSIDAEDLPRLSRARGDCILAATGQGDAGTMAAVTANAATVAPYLDGLKDVVIANDNAPGQVVVSGPTAGVAEAVARLQAAGLSAKPLRVAAAFHSPLVAGASVAFAETLTSLHLEPPAVPVLSNVTASPYETAPAAIRARLAEHIAAPVRFRETLLALVAHGARVLLEVGPGRTLTALAQKTLADRPDVTALATDVSGEPFLRRLLLALAQLAALGVRLRPSRLFEGRVTRRFVLSAPPVTAPPPSAWWVDGFRAWPVVGELPDHALKPITAPLSLATRRAPGGDTPREAVVLEYLQGMRELVETQRQVVLRFLGESASEPLREVLEAPRPAALPAHVAVPPVADAAPRTLQTLTETLVALVAERTGYPESMLGLDLDLEADLSIDSIKRIEILGALAERIGLALAPEADGTAARDDVIEKLASKKSLRAIVAFLETAPAAVADRPAPVLSAVGRHRVVPSEAPLVAQAAPSGARVGVFGARTVLGLALVDALRAAGRAPVAVEDDLPEALDALVLLATSDGPEHVSRHFHCVRAARSAGVPVVLGITAITESDVLHPGPLGLDGLLRAAAREWPEGRVRHAELDPTESIDALAALVLAELEAPSPPTVSYRAGVRLGLVVEPAERGVDETGLSLDSTSVVLATGGARGITAAVVRALVGPARALAVLIGRTPVEPLAAEARLPASSDLIALRRAALELALAQTPAEADRLAQSVVARREVRATLEELRATGATVEYHALDVRDEAALFSLVADVYRRLGRIDVVLHGAGVIEDRLVPDKTVESFRRVYDTKVNSGRALLAALRPDVKAVLFFTSIAGVFGSRGQTDYAAANAALDALVRQAQPRFPGRVLSLAFGPWSGAGMVSAELEREYVRRGIRLIAQEDGIAATLAELRSSDRDPGPIVLTATDPATFGTP